MEKSVERNRQIFRGLLIAVPGISLIVYLMTKDN